MFALSLVRFTFLVNVVLYVVRFTFSTRRTTRVRAVFGCVRFSGHLALFVKEKARLLRLRIWV